MATERPARRGGEQNRRRDVLGAGTQPLSFFSSRTWLALGAAVRVPFGPSDWTAKLKGVFPFYALITFYFYIYFFYVQMLNTVYILQKTYKYTKTKIR